MNSKERINYFKDELVQIKQMNVKKFVARTLTKLPKYFFEVAASSTGKYHPTYCLGPQGLLRHTKAAVKIALELFNNENAAPFFDYEKDCIIAALILHDGLKHGLNGAKYTVVTHPLEVCQFIANDDDLIKEIDDDNQLNLIINCISTHMGQWNTDFRSKKEILEKPSTPIQKFVHLCDYLASRKSIEVVL